MNDQKRMIFEGTLTQPFNHDGYVKFLREFLDNMQIVAPNKELKPYSTFSAGIDHYNHIGNYVGKDKNKVALFSVCLKNDKNLENARSMQRAFVKTLLENSNCAGALVAFYTIGELNKWRLSFVRMDYEFSKGKLSAKLTPAKRYSYLVGKGEPCHTAQERLYPIFVTDNFDPSLDDLEDAFSVEAVTKDFFDQYRDKYLDLKEYLDSNPEFVEESKSRGFDSEQFAKKLMGQIVFLYFIQKKGWLGVNPFPIKLTEREYKNAFYRPGQKPKQLIPYVYKLKEDGYYYRDNQAILSLSAEDETILSTLVKGDKWGDGPKDFMRQIFNGCKSAGKNFFDDYLEPLFYTGLNQNRGDNAFFPQFHRRIPFLNGGLFEEMEGYDWRNNDFSIPNELFSNADTKGKREADGILDVFDRYNFTMAEDEPMEREVAIDPEMLGKVFENLLDVTDRKSKGAFYTPREIVHYMCQESLINYLVNKTGISDEDIRKFVLYGEYFRDEDTKKTLPVENETGRILQGDEIYYYRHHMEYDKSKDLEIPPSIFSFKENVNRLPEIDRLLESVKVVDPAVGSGAFPLGMLNEIVKTRETITSYMVIEMNRSQRLSYRSMRNMYRLKRETIKNCIFACDIEASAVDITKLRLWLSLVIDNLIMNEENLELGYTTKPRELPNLECNIICGDSLMDEFEGIHLLTENAALNNESRDRQMTTFDQHLCILINELIELQLKLYDEKDHTAKDSLKNQIQDIYDKIIIEQISGNSKAVDEYYKAIQLPSKPFVLWQLYFPKVFRDNGGFDIAIGNPPYVQLSKTEGVSEDYKLYLRRRYGTSGGRLNLFIFMIHKGFELLNKNGTISYIVPNTIMTQDYYKDTRKLLLFDHTLLSLVDYQDMPFENAVVENITFIACAKHSEQYFVKINKGTTKQIEYIRSINSERFKKAKNYAFSIDSNDFIESMFEGATPLKELCNINQAIALKGDKSISVKDNYEDGYYRLLDGRNIGKYAINWTGKYLDYSLDRIHSCKRKDIFEASEKLLFRRVSSTLIATYDDEQFFALNTLVVITPKKKNINLKYILALFNSKLMNYIYRNKFKSTKTVFSEIQARSVGELPIRESSLSEEIVVLVNEIIKKKHTDFNADCSELEKKIDDMVYRIYDVSDDQIQIIEDSEGKGKR